MWSELYGFISGFKVIHRSDIRKIGSGSVSGSEISEYCPGTNYMYDDFTGINLTDS